MFLNNFYTFNIQLMKFDILYCIVNIYIFILNSLRKNNITKFFDKNNNIQNNSRLNHLKNKHNYSYLYIYSLCKVQIILIKANFLLYQVREILQFIKIIDSCQFLQTNKLIFFSFFTIFFIILFFFIYKLFQKIIFLKCFHFFVF